MQEILTGAVMVLGGLTVCCIGLGRAMDGVWNKWGPKPESDITVVADNSSITQLNVDKDKHVTITYPVKLTSDAMAYLSNAERPVGEVLTLFLVCREFSQNEYIVADRGHQYIGRIYVPVAATNK